MENGRPGTEEVARLAEQRQQWLQQRRAGPALDTGSLLPEACSGDLLSH